MRLTELVNKGMNDTPIYVGSYGNIVNVGDNVEYSFKDRGRTWALSKEEFYETLSKQKN